MKRTNHFLKTLQRHVMTATSYMLPFIVTGGVLTAISVMLTKGMAVPEEGALLVIYEIGQAGMHLFIPALGGYIAFSIAEKPGLAPGFIGAFVAQSIGAGFIGGMAAGFLAGYTVKALKRIPLPARYRSLGTVFLYPLGGSLVAGGVLLLILGQPLSAFMNWMTGVLTAMSGAKKAPLGMIMGAMIGSDLGGTFNKIACTFAQTQVDTLPFLMGGVGAATGVPPIGLGVSTFLFGRKFTDGERAAGKAGIAMGALGITEGAIPFLASDPIYVIVSSMAGCAVACTAAFLIGCENHAPWGGLIVLPVVTHRVGYLLAILCGVIVEMALIGILRKNPDEKTKKNIDDFELEFEEL